MKTAYSYVRFSTPQQALGDSFRRQTEWAEKWAETNGYRLDNTLTLHDLGVSAYKGDNLAVGKLGTFLEAVQAGKVSAGSVLIVENLDRLSRQSIGNALTLFLNIVNSGVEIVCYPDMRFVKEKLEINQLMYAVIMLSTANQESEKKSIRLSAVWQQKRATAATKPATARCPAWLELDKATGKFVVIEDRANVVRQIFEWAIQGVGKYTMIKRLNAGVACFGGADTWHTSYLSRILWSRAVIGDYQPYTRKSGKRQPIGEPVKGYYPAVISEKTFYKAQAALGSRLNHTPGRKGSFINLFQGLGIDVVDGGKLTMVNKPTGGRQLISAPAMRGNGHYVSIPYPALETTILKITTEIDPKIFAKPNANVAELQGRLIELETKIDKIKNALLQHGDLDTLLEVLPKLESERKTITASLDGLDNHTGDAVKTAKGLIPAIEGATGQELQARRTKLQAAFRGFIDQIRTFTVKNGNSRKCWIQVIYKGGGFRNASFETCKGEIVKVAGYGSQRSQNDMLAFDLLDSGVRAGLERAYLAK